MALPQWTSTEWSAAITAGSSVLTLLTAVGVVYYASRQVSHARQLRADQVRPFVVVDFEPSPVWGNIINLVIENVGQTLARNVRFTFDPPLKSSQTSRGGAYDFGESVLLKQGIPAIPPGRRFEALFDLSHERVKTDLPMSYRVSVDCDDARGEEQDPLQYVLDLNFRYGLGRVQLKTSHDVAKTLEAIEKHLNRWSQHGSGLRVWARDEDSLLEQEERQFRPRAERGVVPRLLRRRASHS